MSEGKGKVTPIKREIKITSPEVSMRKKIAAVQAYLDSGYDSEAVARATGFSAESILQWHQEYGREVAKGMESPSVVASETVKELVRKQDENLAAAVKLQGRAIERALTLIEKTNRPEDVAKLMDAITRMIKELKEVSDGEGKKGVLKKGNIYNLINNQQVIVKAIKK